MKHWPCSYILFLSKIIIVRAPTQIPSGCARTHSWCKGNKEVEGKVTTTIPHANPPVLMSHTFLLGLLI